MRSAVRGGACAGMSDRQGACRSRPLAAVSRRHMSSPTAFPSIGTPYMRQHALQVAGETEVKGQVKLQFRTATGVPVIVTRSYLVSVAPKLPASSLAPSTATGMPLSRPVPSLALRDLPLCFSLRTSSVSLSAFATGRDAGTQMQTHTTLLHPPANSPRSSRKRKAPCSSSRWTQP